MRFVRSLRLLAVLGLVAGTLTMSAPAQGQAAVTEINFRFAGTAAVSPGIFIPGQGVNNGPWTWSFTSAACDGAGVSNGTPVAGAGNCQTSAGGALLPDLLDVPACGNSRGFSSSASFRDPTGRLWSGEIHWDGVVQGNDPSYSLGSQLYLWGEMSSSGAGTARVQLMLNASGGDQCIQQINSNGATSFVVNGVGTIITKVA